MEPEIEAILSMSDEEILADCRARGEDPEQIAVEGLAIFERALAQTKGWLIAVVAFRSILMDVKHQDMTIRELRRLLLINRKSGLEVIGLPQEIAAYINGLELQQ